MPYDISKYVSFVYTCAGKCTNRYLSFTAENMYLKENVRNKMVAYGVDK